MYVVVIDWDNEERDYKAYERSSDAVARFELAHAHKNIGKITKLRTGDEVTVLDCKMFKTNTASVREAVEMVKAGKATSFKKPMTDRDRKLLDDFLADLPEASDDHKHD